MWNNLAYFSKWKYLGEGPRLQLAPVSHLNRVFHHDSSRTGRDARQRSCGHAGQRVSGSPGCMVVSEAADQNFPLQRAPLGPSSSLEAMPGLPMA